MNRDHAHHADIRRDEKCFQVPARVDPDCLGLAVVKRPNDFDWTSEHRRPDELETVGAFEFEDQFSARNQNASEFVNRRCGVAVVDDAADADDSIDAFSRKR
jgi:hypothetical protein